jgi:DNA-binding CsgD family transcriptional regulator
MRRTVTELKLADARALLRLCNALHEAPDDAASRKRLLLEGLCDLLRADAGVCVVSRTQDDARKGGDPGDGDSDRTSIVSVIRWAVSDDDARALAARYRPRGSTGAARQTRAVRAPDRLRRGRRAPDPSARYQTADDCLEALLPVSGTPLRACLTLLRRPPARRRFTARDRALLDLFHREMGWLYRADLPATWPDAAGLPPRQRQILRLLLSGLGEKQIATRLDLSRNTVHHHVKALYRHFHVTTRSELLARWVRE